MDRTDKEKENEALPFWARRTIYRRVLLPISFELLKGIYARPGEIVQVASNDIPPDARVVNATFNVASNEVVLVLESASFPESYKGYHLMKIRGPQYRTWHPWPELQAVLDKELNRK